MLGHDGDRNQHNHAINDKRMVRTLLIEGIETGERMQNKAQYTGLRSRYSIKSANLQQLANDYNLDNADSIHYRSIVESDHIGQYPVKSPQAESRSDVQPTAYFGGSPCDENVRDSDVCDFFTLPYCVRGESTCFRRVLQGGNNCGRDEICDFAEKCRCNSKFGWMCHPTGLQPPSGYIESSKCII